MEYDADGFDQKEQIKLTKLMMMEKHSWTLNIYNIIAGIAIFSLASLIIIFTTTLAVKKWKKQNENTAIRINRSRIYYNASRQQTSSL